MTDVCSIPGCGREAAFALPLKRDKKSREWVVAPICKRCRDALMREARAEGKTIPIYGLEGSKREAERRNAESLTFQPFLKAFAKVEAKTEPKSKLKLVANL
jgi:hypothetical protein